MTKEEFCEKWQPWMIGFALAAFAEAQNSAGDFATKGRHMTRKMQEAKDVLDKMYADLCPGQPAETSIKKPSEPLPDVELEL